MLKDWAIVELNFRPVSVPAFPAILLSHGRYRRLFISVSQASPTANLPAFCGKFPQSRYWSLDFPAKRFFPKRTTSSICEFFFSDKKREAQKDRSLHFVFLRKKSIFVVISSKYFRFLPYHVCLLIHCAGLSSCFFFFISRILIHHVSFLRD